ncbi:MAG: DUF2089 domain-containing protein [Fimbriimonadia bacterium]|jgi:hypothetical protein
MHKQPSKCPVCDGAFHISELTCDVCHSVLRGEFAPSRFERLDKDQANFLEVFLRCRGVLNSVERELGISYPTVRSRLDALLEALGLTPASAQESDVRPAEKAKARLEILDKLEKGEIAPDEAAAALRNLK